MELLVRWCRAPHDVVADPSLLDGPEDRVTPLGVRVRAPHLSEERGARLVVERVAGGPTRDDRGPGVPRG